MKGNQVHICDSHMRPSQTITIQNLEKHYKEITALNGVSLTIKPGEMISLIGRSGAGKTTLLRCLNGLIKPTHGRISVGETDITTLRGKHLRAYQKTVGIIFQQFNLVKRLSVLSNVLVGILPHKTGLDFWLSGFNNFHIQERNNACQCLEQVGILDHALKRADQLSGGQQQRVAIAKILLQSPQLILADEPVASLNPYSAETVMDLLREINQQSGTTVVINMHNLEYAKRFSTRVIGLKKGEIVFDGTPTELTEPIEELIYADGSTSNNYLKSFKFNPTIPEFVVR